jgi:hypothetical protein
MPQKTLAQIATIIVYGWRLEAALKKSNFYSNLISR